MATGGGSQVVKVKREAIEACLKCGLCNKESEEATTISLCLHTFCRKCIFQKLSEEEYDQCPVCDTHLGNLPVTTLRPDFNLQHIIATIFPAKENTVNAPEVNMDSKANDPDVPPSSLPVKGKESSSGGCSFSAEDPAKKDDSTEEYSNKL
ncbi:hypothetical protein FF1_033596 [Malus domestica]|uniref:E3 ubiquitin protein ligase DRIP2-like n=1 Tax=Malus domestica TaxID=3750 RepID=UPI00397509C9